MRIYWPYRVLPACVKDTMYMLHHDFPIEIVACGPLDPEDPRALADFLQQVRSREHMTYSVNNLLQVVEAIRRQYTFRVVELHNPRDRKQSLTSVQTAAVFQHDPLQGLHRIWMHQNFVRNRKDIPNLDNRVPLAM
jgi:hypothetical protein